MVPLAFFYGLVPALWAVGRGMDGEGGCLLWMVWSKWEGIAPKADHSRAHVVL